MQLFSKSLNIPIDLTELEKFCVTQKLREMQRIEQMQ